MLYGAPDYQYGRSYISLPGGSLDYLPAYVVSNERLRYTTGLTRDMGRKILTVAGSGAQPLFYALNGATKVDTFDVSYCARAIMDIKVQAIKSGMSYEKYKKLLTDLHFAPSASRVVGMDEILMNIPGDSAKFVRAMDGYKIFSAGLKPDFYAQEMISVAEYLRLQKMLTAFFSFVWTNVTELHAYLTDEYDVINLSNIFEWNPAIIRSTLASLRHSVRPGGYILVQTGCPVSMHRNMKEYSNISEQFKDWAKLGLVRDGRDTQVVMLERVR